ncbi:MAG: gamma-glutamyltransferase [Gammaproteobacteria bacterium]|nr:gamma-glutamyltransferase [Gammaproteobacteria bacterium]
MPQKLAQEHWTIRKPAIVGRDGMISTQHYLASEVGANVLRDGGNAVDAAVAAGLAIGVVEPWSSGIGGGGYMVIHKADNQQTNVVEFGMRAPFEASRDDYPLDPDQGRTGAGSFNWPAVKDHVNVSGPLSIAVPGYIRGAALALETFGTKSWESSIEPACQLAEEGLPIDWFATQHITYFARSLARFKSSRAVYLPDGYPPLGAGEGFVGHLPLKQLAETYRTLQHEGAEAYYTGSLAHRIVADLNEFGSKISLKDLHEYEPFIRQPISSQYRGAMVQTPGNMTAGPSMQQALHILYRHSFSNAKPNPQDAIAYVEALRETYEYRLEHLGEGKGQGADSHTSHLSVADRFGNLVALTQTVMSPFGSHVVLPQTGLTMNNGMMWFDPMPDRPNSLVGGRHPLCNMCPTVIFRDDGTRFALGACGGRKIFPSVLQLTSFVLDFGMSVDDAVHQARVDVSGNDNVWAMAHFDSDVLDALGAKYDTLKIRPNGLGGNQFAVPQIVAALPDGQFEGGCYVPSPHAAAMAASR